MRFSIIPFLIAPIFANAYEITGKAIHVADGDTITVLQPDNSKRKIRLYGIDAPESGQVFGDKSKKLLIKLAKGKLVTADCIEKDKYQRDVCTIYHGNTDINATMVVSGGAWVYREYYKGSVYYNYESQARAGKRGLWATGEAQRIEPWRWRKGENNNANAPAVKLSRSNICHGKGTKYYNRVKRYRAFDSLGDCLRLGRFPK